jgi:hypothetical protein
MSRATEGWLYQVPSVCEWVIDGKQEAGSGSFSAESSMGVVLEIP